MYSFALIESDQKIIDQIKDILTSISYSYHLKISLLVYNIDAFDDKQYYDGLFLPIKIKNQSGILIAKKYLKKYFQTKIIFLTDDYKLIYDCFDVHPYDCILKNDLNKLKITIIDLIKKINQTNQRIMIKTKYELVSIFLSDIIYCQNKGHLCFIYTNDNIYKTRYQLKQLLSLLNDNFYRINQSNIINWKYVLKIKQHHVYLTNGIILPISIRCYQDSLISLQKFHLLTSN